MTTTTGHEGHPDWPRLQREAAELVDQLAPRLAPRHPASENLPRVARAWATLLRNHATNRRLLRQGRGDLRPLYFIWTLLRACNFRCSYCDDHQGHKYPELSSRGVLDTAQARRLLQIMRTGTPSLYFAGGEPTIRKDLPELTRLAWELSYYPILVNTNASVLHRQLARPEWSTWLADTDIVVVSLDALDLDLLSRMWVTKEPEHVIRNLMVLHALAERTGTKLLVNTVIQPGRIEHARQVMRWVHELGGVWFSPVPLNQGPRIAPGLVDDAEYLAFVDEILAAKADGHLVTGSARMNERLLHAAPLDCHNTLKPHIDYDGHLVWPCKASVNVAPVRINVLDHETLDRVYEHARTLVDPTNFHGPASHQCGADCNWAQNYTTDAYAHGLSHPLSVFGEVTEFLRAS